MPKKMKIWYLYIKATMEKEKLIKTSVYLEEEVIEALDDTVKEFEKQTKMKWSRGAVIRAALSDFFTRKGKIL